MTRCSRLKKASDLVQGVAGEVEADEESLGAVLAHEDGLEHVDVRPACFVFLLHLEGKPDVHEVEFAGGVAAFLRHRGERVDFAVDAHVADLGFVGDAAERDDGPVLELERRDFAELLFGPWQIADDEAAPDLPELFVFVEFADVAQALRHDAAGGGRLIDSDPLAAEILRGDEGGPAAAEGVQDDVVGARRDFDDALQQLERLLCWVAERLVAHALHRADVVPHGAERRAFAFVQVALSGGAPSRVWSARCGLAFKSACMFSSL